MQRTNYTTKGGIGVTREIREGLYQPADNALAEALDHRRGVLFSSSFEFPGRYTRWDMGFVDPPLAFTARGRQLFDRCAEPARPRCCCRRSPRLLSGLPAIDLGRIGEDRVCAAKSASPRSAFRKRCAAASPRSFRCCAR